MRLSRFIVSCGSRFAVLSLPAVLLAVSPSAVLAQPAPEVAAETWSGSVELPGGAVLEFNISITRGDEPSATIDIPAQGALGVPLEVVSLDGDAVVLRIPAPANAEISGTIGDDGTLAGTLKQAGLEFPFSMTRDPNARPALNRPQLPQPPFPYLSEDLVISNPDAGVELAGTLTIPDGAGPFPAAVLVSGSGPQDRDESLAGHKPFLVLADDLTRHGIAVLRFDDRGTGASTGDFASAVTDDFVTDALAAVRAAARDPRIDPARIGIIGHSEGGVVAPMAAVRDDGVAYVVLLAGTAIAGGDVLAGQQAAIMRASGADEETVTAVHDGMVGIVKSIRAGDTEALEAGLRGLLTRQLPGADEKTIDEALGPQVGFFSSPWMRRFVDLDPSVALRGLGVPVLAISGSHDLQVLPADNAGPMRDALEAAPTSDVTILVLPGLNHLFQDAPTGSPAEYGQIEETFSPKALGIVSSWITQRFGY